MLRIRNWQEHYETNETRKLVTLHWVKIPTQQDSLAYRLIASHKRGPEIFAAWILMVQVASKGRKEERGNLPLSPDELGIVTGFPAEIFRVAIDFLKSTKIRWIEESPDALGESPDTSGESPTNLPLEGREGIEEKEESTHPRARKARFAPPSLDEVAAYCTERRNGIDPQHWIDSYAAKGWLVGKSPMRDWRAAVRTWEKNNFYPASRNGTAPKVERLAHDRKLG